MHPFSARPVSTVLALTLLAGCASVPPASSGALTSYSELARMKSGRTQASSRADTAVLRDARTVRIEPVVFGKATQAQVTPAQRALIANAMERALCQKLESRFEVVAAADADLTVRTSVTRIKITDAEAAALSVAIGLVIPTPRLPIGLGGFAAEAEAVGPDGVQAAAMIWSRDADIFSGRRASSIGDAYDLSRKFAQDLSKLMTSGASRVSKSAPTDGCAIYGAKPNLADVLLGLFGAPPEWTDRRQVDR